MIIDHLAQAEQHVASGQETIVRQEALIARLEQEGHDTISAKRLLAQFRELQAMHTADRNRLAQQLADHVSSQNG
jgi:hypothetical protein